MTARAALTSLLLLGVTQCTLAGGETVVVPNEFAGTEAPGANGLPWNPGAAGFCTPDFRYQQMYAAEQLVPGAIIQMAFRRDGKVVTGAQTLEYDDVTITMSTLPTSIEGSSGDFDENLGPDAVVVYEGPLTLEFGPAAEGMPQPFDTIVPLQTPFPYDPAGGNLMFDLYMSSCPNDGEDIFLVHDLAEDSTVVGRVIPTPGGVGNFDDVGLVTQFLYDDELLSPGYSGSWWFGVDQDGEGLLIEIVTVGDDRVIVVYWFTYDDDGEQMWLVGSAPIVDDGPIELDMFVSDGPSFGPAYDPALLASEFWGTLELTFFDCATGEASFDSVNFGAGTYDISRLTGITDLPCE